MFGVKEMLQSGRIYADGGYIYFISRIMERAIVVDKQRHRRLRLMIKTLNKQRKKQAKQIDILCNDFISAQKDFIKKLDTITFMVNFYESIIGVTDLSKLLCTTAGFIEEEFSDTNITFFLRQVDSFELYMFESKYPIFFGKQNFENCFTPELMDNICKSNKICTLEDMFAMGLQMNPNGLNKISAVTIPLSQFGSSLGFMLVCRPSDKKFTAQELSNISAAACGLCRSIASCQAITQSQE